MIVEALRADQEAKQTIDKASMDQINAAYSKYEADAKDCVLGSAEHKAVYDEFMPQLLTLAGKPKLQAITIGIQEREKHEAAREKLDLVAKPSQMWLERRYGKCTDETVLDAFKSAIPKDQAVALTIKKAGGCAAYTGSYSVITPSEFAPIAGKLPKLTEGELKEVSSAINTAIAMPSYMLPLAYVCCPLTCCTTGGFAKPPWCGLCCGEPQMESKLALAVSHAQEKLSSKGARVETKKIKCRGGGTDKEFRVRANGAPIEEYSWDFNKHFLFIYMPTEATSSVAPVPLEVRRT